MNTKVFFLSLLALPNFLFCQHNLKDKIQDFIKSKNAKIGVSVWHLEKKDTISVNGDLHLPMQSVFKFPIAIAVLNEVDNGKLRLDQKVWIKKSILKTNTWSPLRDKYPNGDVSIPLAELISYSVAQSDNIAVDILLEIIGGANTVQDYIQKIGIKDFQIVSNEAEMHQNLDIQYQNYISANGSNLLLKKLYQEPILKKQSRDFLIDVLKSTNTGPNRLEGLLPKGTIVAHKTGTSYTKDGLTAATNDVGVIYLPNNKHVLVSVLVSDSYEKNETNEKIIAEIAKMSYDFYTK